MKKALVYDPYLDTLGGGERYCLTLALGLVSADYAVDIAWPERDILQKAELRYGLDLSSLKSNKRAYELCRHHPSLWKKILFFSHYDLIFWVSDGSLPFLSAKKNFVHFQVPFKKIGGSSLVNKIKTLFIKKFIYNSAFTATVHEKHFPQNKSLILYPPIDVDSFRPGKKEKVILSVARFDSPSHPKRQDILIEAFRILNQTHPEYQLFLAGGSHGTSDTLQQLKDQAGNLPIKFIVNPDFTKLKSLYSQASFFWHAAGYGLDEQNDPEKVEHFGMTTVEAMASGSVPVVIGKGGQKEIISRDTGFLCQSPQEIADNTQTLIEKPKIYQKIQTACLKRALHFSHTAFFANLQKIIK